MSASCSSTLRRLTFLLAIFVAAGLAGCAGSKKVWHKPGVSQEQWVIDSANCRSRAHTEAGREYAAQPGAEPGGVDNGATYDALMRRHGAKRGMESFYRRCLETKGYRLVDPPPPVKT